MGGARSPKITIHGSCKMMIKEKNGKWQREERAHLIKVIVESHNNERNCNMTRMAPITLEKNLNKVEQHGKSSQNHNEKDFANNCSFLLYTICWFTPSLFFPLFLFWMNITSIVVVLNILFKKIKKKMQSELRLYYAYCNHLFIFLTKIKIL